MPRSINGKEHFASRESSSYLPWMNRHSPMHTDTGVCMCSQGAACAPSPTGPTEQLCPIPAPSCIGSGTMPAPLYAQWQTRGSPGPLPDPAPSCWAHLLAPLGSGSRPHAGEGM